MRMPKSVRVEITAEADRDLQAIWRWTRETFSERQANRYIAQINSVIRMIGRNPRLARERTELGRSVRAVRAGAHIVLYTLLEQARTVLIVRIVHGSQDWAALAVSEQH